ncbi:MAG TPA: AAA family ATPase [Gemmataceae bacterium]|jgi:cell division protease FtsH|nr:AAA family ATPase [Gemmataceae bacterium]
MTSILISEKELPQTLTPDQAVEAAYAAELAEVASKLQRGLPCLIECDKDMAPFVYRNVRDRLKTANMKCIYLDGKKKSGDAPSGAAVPMGIIGMMIAQLREKVEEAAIDDKGQPKVIVLPHLDLLTTSSGGLTTEAREVIPLLYENPNFVWLGFKDPSFSVPKVIENLFPHRASLVGIPRARLRQLITQKESRKFGKQFNPWSLYKYVSGVNAVRLRKLLSTLEGEDYPAEPKHVIRQLRQATLSGNLEIPEVNLDTDIGGYERVKRRIKQEILEVLSRRDQLTDADAISKLEELIPRGMILWGPPGTGKTFFAKAMAASIGAAITVVSGPELKSKWVGESEEHLRQIFHRARQSAPAIIVFDELDSFASARGTYTGSGVEHSMVNQLLTEMDGFHKEELVFVVGTTNFVEILDPALLRPGRFEFHLQIPYPEDDDRREIIKIYDRKMKLKMTGAALDYAVRRTGRGYITATGTPFSGDHIQAMCRAVARIRLRENRAEAETTPKEVERGLTEYDEKKNLHADDELLAATHESGHFVVSLCCEHHAEAERITIQSEMPWAPFFVSFKHDETRIGYSRNQLLDMICVLYGGIESERLLLGEISTGAGGLGDPRSDLARATQIASQLVEVCGMADQTGLRVFRNDKGEREVLSGAMAERIDKQISAIISEQQKRAADVLQQHKDFLLRVRDEVRQKKVIEHERVKELIAEFRQRLPLAASRSS